MWGDGQVIHDAEDNRPWYTRALLAGRGDAYKDAYREVPPCRVWTPACCIDPLAGRSRSIFNYLPIVWSAEESVRRDITVRILFTFAGGSGHFDPLVPIARAARAAGHVVAVACGPAMVPAIEAAGLPAFAVGAGGGGAPKRIPLRPVSMRREERDLREGFARRIARERARAILDLCEAGRPGLLVRDEVDFGSVIAAERLGLPHATVLVIAAGSFVRPAVVGGPLHELRAEHGLPPDPDLQMLSRYLVLSPFPPSFRDPAFPLPATAHALRPAALEVAAGGAAPTWLAGLCDAPIVYATLGTVFNMESGDLFARLLAGLRDLPVNLVVTVGRHIDPEEFGPRPDNVRIELYIPQASILPYCSAVVSHGGSGSVIGALARGLPMVVIPMGADQPLNAARCEALGVGRALDAVAATPADVRDAVASVLEDPAYRRAAERIRDECVALPGAAHAVALLERLAAERRPLASA
jgi:UDP:flavonoid glycosyltransferase YjiC (YdhE family)